MLLFFSHRCRSTATMRITSPRWMKPSRPEGGSRRLPCSSRCASSSQGRWPRDPLVSLHQRAAQQRLILSLFICCQIFYPSKSVNTAVLKKTTMPRIRGRSLRASLCALRCLQVGVLEPTEVVFEQSSDKKRRKSAVTPGALLACVLGGEQGGKTARQKTRKACSVFF